jgi:hypothetical protein
MRKDLHDTIKELGHEPVMWENIDQFGGIHGQSSVQVCLDMVEQSDIYFLIIHNRAGSFLSGATRTITHMEFLKAVEKNKLIKIFVEELTNQAYFAHARHIINDFIKSYNEKYNNSPTDQEILSELTAQSRKKKAPQALKETDPYVWILLYKIVQQDETYVHQFSTGVSVDWKLVFSDLLYQGVSLVPSKAKIKEDAETSASLSVFADVFYDLMPMLRIAGIKSESRFFTKILQAFSGGKILRNEGGYVSLPIGEFKSCTAICIFKHNQDTFAPAFPPVGDVSDAPKLYHISDDWSYVVQTYKNNAGTELVFYSEEKNMFYLTKRVGEYIVSCHFPAPNWNNEQFKTHHDWVSYGIMSQGANEILFDFLEFVLGGI